MGFFTFAASFPIGPSGTMSRSKWRHHTGETCSGQTGDITQYQISFQTGSVVVTENVNIAKCTAGRCSHTFEILSNPPSSYDSVSVAAENVVGVGAERMCTTQPISELYLGHMGYRQVSYILK